MKYIITYVTIENCDSDEEAKQLALNKARNERKTNDNSCKVESIIERKSFSKFRNVKID
jgi:hypothetical protein